MLHNRIREWRTKKGLSREDTAHAAEITRQALGQIESEKVCPSTAVALRLCRLFGCTVEDLFYEDNLIIDAEYVPCEKPINSGRVYMAKLAGRWVARAADPVLNYDIYAQTHGVIQDVQKPGLAARIQIRGDIQNLSRSVFISGCDVGLGFLAAFIRNHSGREAAVWFNTTNQQALYELDNRQTHIAAIHFDEKSESLYKWIHDLSYNIRIFEFAKADMGWICMPKNQQFFIPARKIRLGDMRIVNRPIGSGARIILDSIMEKSGISEDQITGYGTEVNGHFSVAHAISEGFAEAGVGHAAAAARFGLSFVPVAHERCALIIREEDMQNAAITQVLDILCSGSFRKELALFGPYDTTGSGDTIPN